MADTLQFTTRGQGLFGPGDAVNIVTFPPIQLHQQTIGPATKGTIHEDVPQDVPLEVLQSAWDRALGICRTTRSVKAVPYCEAYSFTPTQAQCETGSVTLPATVTINCCTNVLVIDTGTTYPACRDSLFAGKADFSVAVPANLRSFDLGAGIGPRPTQPAPAPFDVGLVTTYELRTDVGLDLALTLDAGSVDVSYATRASLSAASGEVAAGQPIVLTARHAPLRDSTLTHLASRYPSVDFAFRYFLDLLARLEVEYAHMGTDGRQQRARETIVSYSTASLPDADADGRLVGELVAVNVGASGAEVRIMADPPSSLPVDFPAGVVFDFPLVLAWDVTVPFTCPIAGVPRLGSYVCGPPPPLSTDVFEIAARTPALDTPAAPEFDGGVVDFGSFTPLEPLRSSVAPDGSLRNTTPSGFREILSVPGLGGLGSLDDILLDDGRLSTDVVRLDLDLDGLATLHQGGVNPLGGNFVFGGNTVDPKTGQNKSVANLEWNMLDVDFANWLHVDQTLAFEPRLVVDLRFSRPVQVREGGVGAFATVSEYTLRVAADADATLEIVQPAGGVTITPSYSLRENLFTNATDILWTAALQESFLQVKVEGIIAQILAAALIPTNDDLNFAVAQSTQSAPPVVMGPVAATPYAMTGFQDVPGTPLAIREPAPAAAR